MIGVSREWFLRRGHACVSSSNALPTDTRTASFTRGKSFRSGRWPPRRTNDRNSIVVKFGALKHPTYFGVQTPTDDFVYLRYLPRGIDILGKKYEGDPINLDIATLQGVTLINDRALPTKVFNTPGEYTLRFQDANHAAYETLHSLSCSVTIGSARTASNQVATTKTCNNSTTITSSSIAASSMLARRVGCNYTGGCATGWPCCNQTFPGNKIADSARYERPAMRGVLLMA